MQPVTIIYMLTIQVTIIWLVLLLYIYDADNRDNRYNRDSDSDKTLISSIKIRVNIAYTVYIFFKILFYLCKKIKIDLYLSTVCQNVAYLIILFIPKDIYVIAFTLMFCIFFIYDALGVLTIWYERANEQIESSDDDNNNHNHLSVEIINYKTGKESEECTICMEKFMENDLLNKLECKHQFHAMCIQQWFVVKHTCPNCRFGEP